MFRFATLVSAVILAATPVAAQSVKSEVQTSEGVTVTAYKDDFAGRAEYTAPKIDFGGGSFALVALVVNNGNPSKVQIVGNIFYNGDWRYYNSAILRGGDVVKSSFADRNVVSCSGSRYSRGCSLSEGFTLMLTDDQIENFAVDGKVAVQMRAQRGEAVIVEIPVAYIRAVKEAAGI